MIYFDNAATTMQKPKQVIEAVTEALQHLGNAGRGAHSATLSAARTVYGARKRLADLFGISDESRIAFTNNATESLNIAINGLFEAGDHVITTVCEHNSVLRPLYRKEKEGVRLSIIPTKTDAEGVREAGIIDYDALEQAYCPQTKAVVITAASNLTGNLTDLARVSAFAKKHKLLLVVDAAQAAGVIPIHVDALGIDIFCFTGHKGLLGPQGTGGIYVREGITLRPLKVGGSGIHSYDKEHPAVMPTALEAGTLNGHGIAGLCGALEYLDAITVEAIREREMALCQRFVDGLTGVDGITLYGNPDLKQRVATVALNIRDIDSAQVSDWLWEDAEIAVRAGAHCAPLMHEALGTVNQGAVRFSFSHYNTEEEIDEAVRVLRAIAKETATE